MYAGKVGSHLYTQGHYGPKENRIANKVDQLRQDNYILINLATTMR